MAKLLEHEEHPEGHHHHHEAHHEDPATKQITNNIDSLLLSVSQQPKLDRAVTDSSVNYQSTQNNQNSPPIQEEEQSATLETPNRVVTPIGTLSVRAATSEHHTATEEKDEHAAVMGNSL